MAEKKIIDYEETFTLGAISSAATARVDIPEAITYKWAPFNEWKVENGSTEDLRLQKDGNSARQEQVQARRWEQDTETSFTTLDIINDGSAATTTTVGRQVKVTVRKTRMIEV